MPRPINHCSVTRKSTVLHSSLFRMCEGGGAGSLGSSNVGSSGKAPIGLLKLSSLFVNERLKFDVLEEQN